MKNKLLLVSLLSFSLLVGCTSNGNNNNPPVANTSVQSVSINEKDITLKVNDTKTLTATVLPENATDKSVTWSSNDTSVASINSSTVTALKAGAATITVTTTDGHKTDSIDIEVRDDVKKSVLKTTFNKVIDTIWKNGGSYYATEDIWDSDSNCYYNDFEYRTVAEDFTMKDAMDTAHYFMSEAFTTVYAPKAYVWEDGTDGFEACYKTDNGVEIGIGDYVDEDMIIMQINVYPESHYDLIDDVKDENSLAGTYALDFTQLDFSGNLYNTTPAANLVSYINTAAGKNILSSIEADNSQIMSIDENSLQPMRKYITIGSGSSEGYVKFNFASEVTSITVTAQAYNKYIDYSSTWSIDTEAKCFVNNEDNDIGVTTTSGVEPTAVTKTFTFDNPTTALTFFNLAGKQRTFILAMTVTLK